MEGHILRNNTLTCFVLQLMLGDIVISVETAARQAEERGHTLIDEIRILMVGLYYLSIDFTKLNNWSFGWDIGNRKWVVLFLGNI